MSTTLATTVRQPSQPPRRQNTFSMTIRLMNSPNGNQTLAAPRSAVPCAMESTSSFIPYCTATAQLAAPTIRSSKPPKCHGRSWM